MHHRHAAVLIAGLSSIAIGCEAGDAPTHDAFSVTDSAGIEIVESVIPAWDGDGWRVSDTPSVVIGRVEGDERYLFGWVNRRNGAVVLRDGRIAVLDGRSALIRVYSPEGEHLEDWGGRGEGPGEFSSPAEIFPYRGDSIVVSEELARRFVIFDDRGRFGRNARSEMWQRFLPDAFFGGSCCTIWAPLPTGAFLLSYPQMIPNTGSGMRRGSVSAAVIPDTGGEPDTVGVFTGGRFLPGSDPQAPPGGFHFQPSFNMAVGPDGYFVTDGETYSIEAYDTSGRLRRIFRLAREPREVTNDVKSAYEDQRREEIVAYGDRLEEPPEEMLRRTLSAPYPSHLPTFELLHVDPGGNVWAGQEPHDQGDDMNDFHVFGPDGRYLGIVEVPASLRVFQIGADFILGMVRDDLGVQYIHRYRIDK